MWKLTKTFRFEAAHRLPHHQGKCQRLHGHSWVGHLVVEGHGLQTDGPSTGMLVDFSSLKSPIQPLLDDYLDHHYLNETTAMEDPTSEMLARWIFDAVKPAVPLLAAVIIEETCTSSCEYRPPFGPVRVDL